MSRNGSDPVNTWVRTQAAQHTTSESIQRRIAFEREQISSPTGAGPGGDYRRALEAHQELIRVLSERLEAIANDPSDL
jgi:hypothetical protein